MILTESERNPDKRRTEAAPDPFTFLPKIIRDR